MRLKELQIEAFGTLDGKTVSGLTTGVNVLYGPNESGKTTLLEFIRRILFGFPNKRSSSKYNLYDPRIGGVCRGSLICQLRNGELLSVHRKDGAKGGALTITPLNENDSAKREKSLDPFLGFASKTIFENIFAVTLDELQDINSLNDEETTNRVYGAGLGLGSVSLAGVESKFRKLGESLFLPRGRSAQKAAVLLSEIQSLEKEIGDLQDEILLFDSYHDEKNRLKETLNVMNETCKGLENEKALWDMRHDLFPNYLNRVDAESRLASLDTVPEFSAKDSETSTRFKIELDRLNKQIREEEKNLRQVEVDMENLHWNADLLDLEACVENLFHQEGQIQTVLNERDALNDEILRVKEEVQLKASLLGLEEGDAGIDSINLSSADKAAIESAEEIQGRARENQTLSKARLDDYREQWARNVAGKPTVPVWMISVLTLLGLAGIGLGWEFVNPLLMGLAGSLIFLGLVSLLFFRHKADGEPDALEKHLKAQLERCVQEQEKVHADWEDWIRKKGIPRILTPRQCREFVTDFMALQSLVADKNLKEKRRNEMRLWLDEINNVVENVFRVLNLSSLPNDLLKTIRVIEIAFRESQKSFEQDKLLQKRLQELKSRLDQLNKELKSQRDQQKQWLQDLGLKDEVDFERKFPIWEERQKLKEYIEDQNTHIQSRVGSDAGFDTFIKDLKATTPEQCKQELKQLKESLDLLQEERDTINRQIGELQNKIHRLATSDDLASKRMQLESCKQDLQFVSKEWAVTQIALYQLQKAKRKYEEERQPGVIRSAEKVFSSITGGKYERLQKLFDSDDIFAFETGSGLSKTSTQLSRGTREQLYLAMRLGFIEEYEKSSEPLPVIMDDLFVNFDDERREKTLQVLADFAKSRQVIILSCHQHALEDYEAIGAKVISV